MKKTVLIMAGGTGGHIMPGLAIAQELQNRGWDVHWLGTADRMESHIVPKHDIPISFIHVQGLRGSGVKRLLMAPWMLLRAICGARRVIQETQPTLVIGFGGYASGPGGIAAWLSRIPLVIHEQNAIAGTTNKLLSRFSRLALMGFPGAFQETGSHVVTGNPVRQEIIRVPQQEVSHEINILVVGGSLGAEVFNTELPKIFATLNEPQRVNVHHQCGKDRAATVYERYQEAGFTQVTCQDFIDDMATAYAEADLVICRSGALTVAEIAAAGKAAVFVPYPHATDDHQTMNAKYLSDSDAGYLIQQKELAAKLPDLLNSLLLTPNTIEKVAKRAKEQAKTEATKTVCDACEQLLGTYQ